MIKFGFASQKITPEIGVQLAGFLGNRESVGVHDDLFTKVLYLNFSDKDRYIFIVLDTLAVFKEFSFNISTKIEKELRIPREHIFISATHTHSGPDLGIRYLAHTSKKDEKLIEYTVHQTIKAVLEAVSKNYEGKFEFTSVKFEEQICGNRRLENSNNTTEVKIFLLKALSGEIALAYNFGCHPTVLHEENLYISADFPGKVASLLAENVKNIKLVVFLNGAAGDISTRFFRKESSFNELDRIGTIVANNIKSGLSFSSELKLDEKHFNAKEIPISLKIRELPSQESLVAMLKETMSELENAKKKGIKNLRPYQSKIEGINSILANTSPLASLKHLDTFIKIIMLDDLIFIGIPGEIFSTLGKQIEDGLKPLKVILVGYCWDYIGYIPDIKAYEEGGYETLVTLLEKGEGEKIVETVIKEVKSLVSQ